MLCFLFLKSGNLFQIFFMDGGVVNLKCDYLKKHPVQADQLGWNIISQPECTSFLSILIKMIILTVQFLFLLVTYSNFYRLLSLPTIYVLFFISNQMHNIIITLVAFSRLARGPH
jgi:hypothetical protein